MGPETFDRTNIQNLSLSGIIKTGSSFLWNPPKKRGGTAIENPKEVFPY
jgi:hypothetical protein